MKSISEDIEVDVDNIINHQSNPEWFRARIEEYKPLKENSQREEDIWDIMEIWAYRHPDKQEILDDFRMFIYVELSKVSDSEVPHTEDEKRNFARTRWARYVITSELSNLT